MTSDPPPAGVLPPPPATPPRRSALPWLLATFGVLAVLGLGLLAAIASLAGGRGVRLGPLGGGEGEPVGLVDLRGPINDMTARQALDDLWSLADDDEILALVLRIDSPGGEVGPSQELYEEIRRLRAVTKKPVVASMGSVAASGGYYGALGCDRIYANPGTLTASIGVILMTTHGPELLDAARVAVATYKSGALKDAGSFSRMPGPPEQAFFDATVRDVFGQFTAAVKEARGLEDADLAPVLDGRVVSGLRAQELRLVDELGGLMAAATKSLELAGKPAGTRPRFVRPRDDVPGWVRALLTGAADTATSALREATDPTAAGGARLQYRAPLPAGR